ncbi:dihydroxy-acid dehydratase, chloroplastic isoform X4 [Manihot esculenta]|uniref:dihydroxy-acid dehydratase, chloroplastic isoform X4 n=1 Tax=Manihot esculenta TaxID=3983 RepID=UPI001CC52A0F|nr:dihydroxy-acid dehydratase, chloroplastic isoform X4 [Manihot esculenta]
MALGGSTNAVLHLIAIARSVGLELTVEDFQKVSDKVPFLADLKPSGKYVMEDLHKDIIRPLENPIKETGHIQILRGNLAPEGSVAKITGKEGLYFSGPTLIFEGEEAMIAAISENPMNFKDCAMLTDGRFSGGSHGFVVGHVCPEAQDGDPIGLVRNGDIIRIDVRNRRIDVEVAEQEMEERRKNWTPLPFKATSGVLYKYIKNVQF